MLTLLEKTAFLVLMSWNIVHSLRNSKFHQGKMPPAVNRSRSIALDIRILLASILLAASAGMLLGFPRWADHLMLFLAASGVAANRYHLKNFKNWRRRAKLHENALCPHCGYPLANLPPGHRCPECGEPYVLGEVQEQWREWMERVK